jgi:hypothetical protein
MDLHAWITRQVDRVERLIEENEWPPSQTEGVRLRCEADRRILARHRRDPECLAWAACKGCGNDDWGLPNVENQNDCPELLDLAHAHGITDDIFAGLDRPQQPKIARRWGMPALTGAQQLGMQAYTPMRDVPEALRGPHWKP